MRPSSLFFHLFFCIGTGSLLVSTRGETTSPTPNLINDPKKHLVTVVYENDSKEISFLCYGVRIQPKYFITTASCFDSFKSPDTGRLSIKENTIHIASVQRPNGQRVSVVGVLEHPDYTTLTTSGRSPKSERRNDLAILRVEENLENITTKAIIPVVTPQYGAPFSCSVMVFKDEMNPDNLIGLKANVVPSTDLCVSNDQFADDLKSLFCLQLKSNEKIKKEYISGAPVACLRYDTFTIYGILSWGYDPSRQINNLVATSLASHQKWIRKHDSENFVLPGQMESTPGPSTNNNPTSNKPTPDPGQSTPKPGQLNPDINTADLWFPEATHYYPEYDDDNSAGLSFPPSMPIFLILTACVLAY